mmetsp:Transcript_39806/g.44840  ORF Transcript_39806/g.44840 Transcript_39806/m.44840 type:complete len:230 (-) Transcript_39806:107-796(-)
MGKTSKQRQSTDNKSRPCYHGCTKQEFHSVEHEKILDSLATSNKVEINALIKKYERYMVDPTFGRFVIARIADDYLQDHDFGQLLHRRLLLLLQIRYVKIPWLEGKDVGPESHDRKNFLQYCRDIRTERGRLQCIAREIPCDCMEEKRREAEKRMAAQHLYHLLENRRQPNNLEKFLSRFYFICGSVDDGGDGDDGGDDGRLQKDCDLSRTTTTTTLNLEQFSSGERTQ